MNGKLIFILVYYIIAKGQRIIFGHTPPFRMGSLVGASMEIGRRLLSLTLGSCVCAKLA